MAAFSDVSISNLALQLLGAVRVSSLTDDSRNARSCNACYAALRDGEIVAYRWNFAKKRVVLAPSSVTPAFHFTYAFPLPTDCLAVLLPRRTLLDWSIEDHQGQTSILTNDGDTLDVRYIAQITDPTRFDPSFALALAARMADHMCEEITQSNEKKAVAAQKYKEAIATARRTNAFQTTAEKEPEDTWLLAQRAGSLYLDA